MKNQPSILQAKTNSKLSSRHSNRSEDLSSGMTENSFNSNDSNSSSSSSSSSYFFTSSSTSSFFSSSSTSNNNNNNNNNNGNLFHTTQHQQQRSQSQLFNYHGSHSEKRYPHPTQNSITCSNNNMTTRRELEKSSIDDKTQFDVVYNQVK